MTKNQKIWFSVFLIMFIVPEILWGGIVGRVIYYWILGNKVGADLVNFNLFPLPQIIGIASIIYLIEFIGVLLSFVYSIIYYHPKQKLFKFLLLMILGALLFVALYYFIFAISFSNMSIG